MSGSVDERSFHAGQALLAATKRWWSVELYQRLRDECGAARGAGSPASTNVSSIAASVEPLATYQYFAWLERHLQRMKYSGRYGLVPCYSSRAEAAEAALAAATPAGVLELDPAVRLPGYYTAIDTHQHPGGLWSERTAGIVYEQGARTTTPLLGAGHASLHERFTALVASRCRPQRILDMGCGFGKSTRPFITTFADATVTGVDLSEPCLRLAAAAVAPADAGRVRFLQRDAARSRLPGSTVDLVTSTMFLHEIPPDAIRDTLRESFRVLEPGGTMVHLDFWLMRDAFTRFLHYGHGRRNNEPYMRLLAELDLPGELRAAGFTDVEIMPFSENGKDQPSAPAAWRFPWTVILARKPADAADATSNRGH